MLTIVKLLNQTVMEKPEPIPAYLWILGIDVSKDSLDACLVRQTDGQLFEHKFHNNLSGFRHMKTWCKQMECECDVHTLCCLEHTGLYTRPLVHYMISREVGVWLESSLQIKRSQGLQRGKSDKIDAQRIARYAHLHQKKAQVMQISTLTLEKLKDHSSQPESFNESPSKPSGECRRVAAIRSRQRQACGES